jgi:hypothetical protein
MIVKILTHIYSGRSMDEGETKRDGHHPAGPGTTYAADPSYQCLLLMYFISQPQPYQIVKRRRSRPSCQCQPRGRFCPPHHISREMVGFRKARTGRCSSRGRSNQRSERTTHLAHLARCDGLTTCTKRGHLEESTVRIPLLFPHGT